MRDIDPEKDVARLRDVVREGDAGVAGGKHREEMPVYRWGATGVGFRSGLVGTGAADYTHRQKKTAKPRLQGRIHQSLTTLANHGLPSHESRP